MLPRNSALFALLLLVSAVTAQSPSATDRAASRPTSRPSFRVIKQGAHLPVLSQDRTNTCWSFATVSFLESEVQRVTQQKVDLSEMWFARMTIVEKAERFVQLHGFGRFDEGGLAHDVTEVLRVHGALPADTYSGLPKDCTTFNHAPLWNELQRTVKPFVTPVNKLPSGWRAEILSVADRHLATELPLKVDPKAYAATLGIQGSDFVEVMSDANLPFNDEQELLVPDNWMRWQKFRNRPVDDFVTILTSALREGATAAVDFDVSEPGFRMELGVADVPADAPVSQESRDAAFQSRDTTDDHLMHAVGIAEDHDGTMWILVKNSWGNVGPFQGYIYISERYLRMKCLNYMIHRSFVPERTTKR